MSIHPNSQIVILPEPRAQTSVQSSDIRERPPPPPPRPPLLGPTYSLTLQSPPPVISGRNQMAHPPHDPYYLQQQPPLPPQQQDYSDRSVINTLFVSGLPDDVKAREIHNLFRRRPGFDSCQLKYTGRGNQVKKAFPFSPFSFCLYLCLVPEEKKSKPSSKFVSGRCFCYVFQSPISNGSSAFVKCEQK